MNAGVWTTTDGNYAPVPLDDVPTGTGFTGEITDFANSILTGAPAPIGPEYARHIMEVLLAAEKSSETGREVVIG